MGASLHRETRPCRSLCTPLPGMQVSADNAICGVVTEGNLTAKLMSGRVKGSDPVTAALYVLACNVSPPFPCTRARPLSSAPLTRSMVLC
jgi:hypothetical protein